MALAVHDELEKMSFERNSYMGEYRAIEQGQVVQVYTVHINMRYIRVA